jgi:uncharacterized protein (TIGR03435 family)
MSHQKLLFLLLFCASVLQAQSAAARPKFEAFEVASIKPAAGETKGRFIRMQSANRFYARNHTLKTLIEAAYNLSPKAVSGGPSWFDSDRYEILAKTPGDVRPDLDEQMAMLRQLLADRFQLKFHREEKEFSLYALTVAKGGPKFKESTISLDAAPEGPPPLVFVLGPDGISCPGRSATIAELASILQRAALELPVVDKTGLTGRYDFDLKWTPDETQFGGEAVKIPGAKDSDKADLFTALQQQLGLKLQAAKGPLLALVVDHAEKPSEN